MPAADPWEWTEAGYASDLLLTYQNFSVSYSGYWTYNSAGPTPTSVIATGTGTATWAVLCNTVNKATHQLIVDVSDDSGNGIVQIETTNIVTGNTYQFLSFGILFTF